MSANKAPRSNEADTRQLTIRRAKTSITDATQTNSRCGAGEEAAGGRIR
jgi:hypothetical protein